MMNAPLIHSQLLLKLAMLKFVRPLLSHLGSYMLRKQSMSFYWHYPILHGRFAGKQQELWVRLGISELLDR